MTRHTHENFLRLRERRRIFWGAGGICLGIAVITLLSWWSVTVLLGEQARESAVAHARMAADKDMALRTWMISVGSVYARVGEHMAPNPYLSLEGRDVTLPNGQVLTRVNPAYAVRLVQEKWEGINAGKARLVSIDPMRPQNIADAWEASALDEFARTGLTEKHDVEESHQGKVVRFMRALEAESRCLTCHMAPGPSRGKVLGGISVIQPVSEMWSINKALSTRIALQHGGFALLGVIGLCCFAISLARSARRRDTAEAALKEIVGGLERRADDSARRLRASEEHSLRLLNATTDGMIGVDMEGTITFANAAALNMLGFRESELIGCPLHESLHGVRLDGSPHLREDCQLCDVRLSANTLRFEVEPFRRKDGSMVMVSGSIAPVREDGVSTGAILAFHDVEEFYKTEVLRRMIFDHAGEPFFIWDENRSLRLCNMAAVKYLGASSVEEVVGDLWRFVPEVQESGLPSPTAILAAFNGCDEQGFFQSNLMFRHADGSLLPAEGNMVKVVSALGTGYFGSVHDLRDIRAYEQILSNERELLQAIINAAPAAMLICSEDDSIWLCNPSANRLAGIDAGRNINDFLQDPSDYARLRDEARRGLIQVDAPLAVCAPDKGSLGRETLAGISTVSFDGSDAFLVWLQDITDLNMARLAAEASTRAKSDFLARMSHEIRTPMNAVLGMTHLMLQTEINDTQRHYLVRAGKAARNLLGLINDILDFSKIEAGHLEMEAAPFLLSEVLENMADVLSFSTSQKDIELFFYVAPEVPYTLVGDILRFSQVLTNLASNAIKFTDHGSVVVRVFAEESSATDVFLRFEVCDTGIGISEEQAALLFKPFQQVDSSMTRRYGGTGLGLVICERLVSLMGGTISVAGELGKGSTFTFTARFGRIEGPEPSMKALGPLRGRRVLVTAPTTAAQETLSALLADLGLNVSLAADAKEAMSLARAALAADAPFDLALLDLDLPDLKGPACAASLRSILGNDLPCLVQVNFTIIEDYRAGLRGDEDYIVIPKPVGRIPLRNAIVEGLGLDIPSLSVRSSAEADAVQSLDALQGKSILLVEDNEINLEVACFLLESLGPMVTTAMNGEEAVMRASSQQFDLILMDIQMPVMDGLEATRRIRALPGNSLVYPPIVAMTAHAMAGDRERSIEAGMNDHITKPIDPQMLQRVLLTWLCPIL